MPGTYIERYDRDRKWRHAQTKDAFSSALRDEADLTFAGI